MRRPHAQFACCLRAAVPTLLGLTLGACASVREVSVAPATVCPGDPVTVSWDATGRTEVAAIPLATTTRGSQITATDYCVDALAVGAPFTSEPSRGSLTAHAVQDTSYFVVARGWFGKPAHRCGRLFVNGALPLSAIPQCLVQPGGSATRDVQVTLVRPADSRWGPSVTTGAVDNVNDVPITLHHNGRSLLLAPHVTTAAFEGSDPNSSWTVDYAWADGPVCGQAGAPIPNALSLQIHPRCSASTQIQP